MRSSYPLEHRGATQTKKSFKETTGKGIKCTKSAKNEGNPLSKTRILKRRELRHCFGRVNMSWVNLRLNLFDPNWEWGKA